MGIRPTGGEPLELQVDTPQSRYSQLVGEAGDTGSIVGDEVGNIGAEAGSANEAASQLAGQVADLQASFDWVSADNTTTIQRRGRIVTAQGRATIPATTTYVDIPVPDWAIPTTVTQNRLFPAAGTGVTGYAALRVSSKVIRIFGAADQTLYFTTTYAI